MALRSGLALWAYTSPTTAAFPLLAGEYGDVVEALEFTTVAPGGFGDLACLVKLPDARLPRPELGLFSRVCLRDGLVTCFSGEWSDPAVVLDAHQGEHVLLAALGGGIAMRDDPDDSSYASQTAQQIMAAEFSKRSAYLALDSDQSLVFPTNPATTFSPVYDGRNLEEIAHDLCFALGDYTWGVWDHAVHRDAAGYPTWQLSAHARDQQTTHYLALQEDILAWRVAPSEQRAFNVVQVAYVDVTAGPATVTVADSRLSGNGGQNLAPFRRRKLRRNLGATPLTSAQATTIANAWLAAYENVTNKAQVELRSVRDGNGVPIPLHQVRADKNLFVPQLGVRGQSYGLGLAGLPTGPVAGVNQFWIAESRYRETASGEVTLTLQLDHYADDLSKSVGKLVVAQGAASRARGVYRAVASPGASEVGYCGGSFSNAATGQTFGPTVNFKQVLSAAPTSITLSVDSGGTANANALAAGILSVYGFNMGWNAPSAGLSYWHGRYQTNGN
jgi:hypothetical protein